jgi:hypothetical protein
MFENSATHIPCPGHMSTVQSKDEKRRCGVMVDVRTAWAGLGRCWLLIACM